MIRTGLDCLFVVIGGMLQKILSCQCSDSKPEEDNDNAGDNEEHKEGDGNSDEGSCVEAEALWNRVEIDHNLVLVILSQLELDICRGHNLNDSLSLNVSLFIFLLRSFSLDSPDTENLVTIGISDRSASS